MLNPEYGYWESSLEEWFYVERLLKFESTSNNCWLLRNILTRIKTFWISSQLLLLFINIVFSLIRVWQTPIPCCLQATSAKNISVRAEWLRQSGRAPSEPSETPRWQTTPCPAPIRRVTLHIALRSRFRRFFSLCRYPIVNGPCGVVANSDHTLEWVHWVHQQNVNRSGRHTQGSIRKRHFVYHIRLCYSHKISYLIICHALFKYLYIYIWSIWPKMVVEHNQRF